MSDRTGLDVRPGRTLSIEHLAFDGFPDDGGLWWLRWTDYGAATGTSRSSFLHLLFSRLPDGTSADALPVLGADLAARPSPSCRSEAHVGWLPVLKIGLVVLDGMVVGELGAEVRHFRFEAQFHEERVELLLHATPSTVAFRRNSRRRVPRDDTSFEHGDRPGLLHPDDYPLPGVRDGRLLSLGPKGRPASPPPLVLPCAEVVRVAYTPHAALARAVIDHPWSRRMSQVLDMKHTGPLSDGSGWQVAPLAPLRREHIAVAANLALNPVALRRANLVSGELHAAPAGVLIASLPFEWQVLDIQVACVRLRSNAQGDQWFGYAIEWLRWPPPPQGPPQKIDWAPGGTPRPKRNRQPGGERPSTLRVGARRRPGPGGRVVQDDDPRPAAPLDVVAGGAGWLDSPDVSKVEEPGGIVRSGEREGPRRLLGRAVGRLAAAEPGRRPGGPAPADPQAVRPAGDGAASLPSPRFQEVFEMLGSLVAAGMLEANEVLPADGAELERRGDVAAWAFPPIPVARKGSDDSERSWYIRDFVRVGSPNGPDKDVRRAAMVCRLTVGGEVVYWIETEPRTHGHDRRQSLIFAVTGAMPIAAVVRRLLAVAAERAGVWPTAAEVKRLVAAGGQSGVEACAGWRHVRLKPGRNVPARLGPLLADAAFAEIRKVCSP